MGKPFPIVKHGTPIEEVLNYSLKKNEAVLVELEKGSTIL
jgi:cystathionine beta-synthase